MAVFACGTKVIRKILLNGTWLHLDWRDKFEENHWVTR